VEILLFGQRLSARNAAGGRRESDRAWRIPMLEMINSSYEGAATGQQHSALERFPSAHR